MYIDVRPGGHAMITLRRHRTRRVAGVLATIACTAAGVSAQTAQAHYVRVNWSYKKTDQCESSRITDPVSLVYYGSGATYARSVKDLSAHTGWRNDDRDSFLGVRFTHHFRTGHSSDVCKHQHGERANNSGVGNNRLHTRFHQSIDRDSGGRWHTFMTPHAEIWQTGGSCRPGSHSVEPGHWDKNNPNKYYVPNQSGDRISYSGFDQGRDRAIGKITSGRNNRHKVKTAYWRNTHSVKQCTDDWWAGKSQVTFGISLTR